MNSEKIIPLVVFIAVVLFVKMSDVKHIWDKQKTNFRKCFFFNSFLKFT